MVVISEGLSRRRVKQTSVREHVRGILLEEITSGRFPIGHKLQSIHALAKAFGISPFPVREALADLEARGYVQSKHGSGTYVTANQPPLTVADAVMLCIEAKAHLFGDFGSLLMGRLLNKGFLPGVVDTGFTDNAGVQLHRALASDARFFVAHGVRSFDFNALQRAALPGRHIIGVIDWEAEIQIAGVHQIVTDHAEGGRLVARHLYARGHRHVLLLGTDSMIYDIAGTSAIQRRNGWGFVEAWKALGGTWQTLCSDVVPDTAEITLNTDSFLNCFQRGNAPTAIFGLRDVEAWQAQTFLLNHAPALATSVKIVGYGNTPWSQAGHPPFTTVELQLERMAEETARLIEALRAEESMPSSEPVVIQPSLVVRG